MSNLATSQDSTSLPTWKEVLAFEKSKEYFKEIITFIEAERSRGKIIYPSNANIFHALAATSLDNVRVVIIGQDPYHGPNQAHGLCFSVQEGVPPPPSLQNIFLELKSDLGIQKPAHGCLESWANQGVLLLNAILSVEAGLPGSHSKLGWEQFTDAVIKAVNEYCSGVVFLLWGSFAQKKAELVDASKHFILKAPHPSPLSAHRGFLGCKHFSQANALLKRQGKTEINWGLALA